MIDNPRKDDPSQNLDAVDDEQMQQGEADSIVGDELSMNVEGNGDRSPGQ